MEKIIISCLESRVETNRSIYARFLLGPFKNDQAVTIATALRRSLLSQVKSIAITAIHIQGVTHEFSTIVGVRESVLDLALNFQQVVLCAQSNKQTNVFNKGGVAKQSGAVQKRTGGCKTKFCTPGGAFCNGGAFARTSEGRAKATLLQAAAKTKIPSVLKTKRGNAQAKLVHTPVGQATGLFVTTGSLNQVGFDSNPVTPLKETTKIGYLQVQGPKVIYANDLKLPVGVKCVDPTQYIATLSTEGLLVVKFVIGEKKVSFEDNKEKLIANLNPDIQNGYQNIAPAQLLYKRTELYKKEAERAQTGAYKNELGSCKNDPGLQNETGLFVTAGVPAFASGGALNKSSFNALQKNLSNYDSNKIEPYYANTTNARIFDSTISLRNTIFLDPIFDSVFKVNYLIEKDDLFNQSRERILLELWTNGSIHPRQALHTASLSLISTFSIFQNVFHLDSL